MEILNGIKQFETKSDTVSNNLSSVKIIGVYFSAHWCPPCRGFTPVLTKFYNKVNENEKVFEVVFVSLDRDEKTYRDYLSTMPWIALSFEHDLCDDLRTKFKISGVPRLVVLTPDGQVIEENARDTVTSQGVQAFSNWITQSQNSGNNYAEGEEVSVT